jgi:hypothetical protein
MDFSESPFLINQQYRYIFSVRDLASGFQLAWQPVASQTAEEVIPILRRLVQQHGAPLVLKSDNGSAFIAELLGEAMINRQPRSYGTLGSRSATSSGCSSSWRWPSNA